MSTEIDPTLSQVLQLVRQGWPDICEDKTVKPFFHRQNELSTHEGCLLATYMGHELSYPNLRDPLSFWDYTKAIQACQI